MGSQALDLFITRHLESYATSVRVAVAKLESVWDQLDIIPTDQVKAVEDAATTASRAWSARVELAEAQRQQMRDAVEAALHDIADIKRQLGDEGSSHDETSLHVRQCCAGPCQTCGLHDAP